jgi:hypothetical protein
MADNDRQPLARWRSILDIIAAVSMTLATIVMILWVARSYVRRPHVVQVEPALPTEPVASGDPNYGVTVGQESRSSSTPTSSVHLAATSPGSLCL